ncbi:helix-turn-helix domain-containing protein [Paraclostridium bifermentans]|uniref:helix-turn-helix domain-containing protein n=1 Tax=Paraclostridium bifermentans TaxID=1490 RepID=UPI0029094794|nr:helix-turn-helix domain-containing protein [Paraclostridium bifermentans]MDU3337542.1 helix-turn-helix domain-containing protein [Paraclostridium bifermentans]
MAIRIKLDIIMVKRKIILKDLAKKIDIKNSNLSILKNNKAKAIRFSTLNELCKILEYQTGDILEFIDDDM